MNELQLACGTKILLLMLGAALLGFLIAWFLRKLAIRRLKNQYAEKESAFNQLNEEHDMMKSSYGVLQGDYNQIQESENSLTLKLNDTGNQLNSLESRYAVLSREKVALGNKLESLEKSSRSEAEYEALAAKYEASLAEKQSEYDGMQGKYNMLLAEQKEQQAAIASLKEEKDKLGGMVDNLQNSLTDATANTSIKEDKGKLGGIIDNLQSSLADATADDSVAESAIVANTEGLEETPSIGDEDSSNKTEEIKAKLENTTEEIKAKLGSTWSDMKKRLTGLVKGGDGDNEKAASEVGGKEDEPFWDTPIVELVKGEEEEQTETDAPKADETTETDKTDS